jgi:hypothetical protein
MFFVQKEYITARLHSSAFFISITAGQISVELPEVTTGISF